jgi:oligopeptide transport system substrate-binding protein
VRRRGARSGLIALLLLAGCSAPPAPVPPAPASPSATPSAGSGTLRVAVSEPEDLLPQRADTLQEQWIADAVFDSLTAWGPGLRPVRAAASSWEHDGLSVWRFRLRADATWHDGAPVTAADFVRGWNRTVSADVMAHLLADVQGYDDVRAGRARSLSGVRAVSPSVLEVALVRPFADFPSVAGHPALAPLPEGASQPGFAAQPVGNGPFMAAEARVRGRFVRVRRFADWRNGPSPVLDEVVFQTMDAETAFLAFQQGRVHVAEVPPGALPAALERYGEGIQMPVRPSLYALGMDVTRPPFDQPAVRRALTRAVDRATMAASIREGATEPAAGLLVPTLPEWTPEACADCAFDPVSARAGFAAAGVTGLTLTFNEGGGHEQVADRLRRDLALAGVTLTLQPMTDAAYFAAVRGGRLSLFRSGWQADVPIADAMLRPLLHSAAVPSSDRADVPAHNAGRYRSAAVDALLDQAAATESDVVRAARYRQAARQAVFTDHALVPLFAYRLRVAMRRELQRGRVDAMGLIHWPSVSIAS